MGFLIEFPRKVARGHLEPGYGSRKFSDANATLGFSDEVWEPAQRYSWTGGLSLGLGW